MTDVPQGWRAGQVFAPGHPAERDGREVGRRSRTTRSRNIRSFLDNRRVKRVASALGLLCLIVGLAQFGAWQLLRKVVTTTGSNAGTVLLWLALGALLLTVATLGGQLLSSAIKWPAAIAVH